MQAYIVNKNAQTTGEHEVHLATGCTTPPDASNSRSLGNHANCRDAVTEAKKIYANVDGCKNCIPACHTR